MKDLTRGPITGHLVAMALPMASALRGTGIVQESDVSAPGAGGPAAGVIGCV